MRAEKTEIVNLASISGEDDRGDPESSESISPIQSSSGGKLANSAIEVTESSNLPLSHL